MTAFENAKPFKFACGSYHNVCLSYRAPKQEEQENEANDENQKVGKVPEKQQPPVHNDEDCPNVEAIKKLKGEIKRLRQEIILKGSSKSTR